MTFRSLERLVLLEEDRHDEVLVTWAYPTLMDLPTTRARGAAIFKHARSESPAAPFLLTHRIGESWCYSCVDALPAAPSAPSADDRDASASSAVRFQIMLTAEDYHPEQYLALVELLGRYYTTKQTPLCLLDCFIKVFTTSRLSLPVGEFLASNFDKQRAAANLDVKLIVSTFGEEVILLWNALILKKRVLVCASSVSKLSAIMTALPCFVLHRAEWARYFWPFVTGTEEELAALRRASLYVVGTTEDLHMTKVPYDLLANVDEGTTTIHHDAQSSFILNSYHKGLMNALLGWCTDAALTNADVLTRLRAKTEELLSSIPAYLSAHQGKDDVSKPLATFMRGVGQVEGLCVSPSTSQ